MFVEKLETTQLVVKHPENPDGDIVAVATKDGVGLWLTQGKRMVSLYNLKTEVAIGIFADREKSSGMTIAVTIDDKNEPQIQLVNSKNEVKYLSFADFK